MVWKTLLVDFKILDLLKLIIHSFHFKVGDSHWLVMLCIIFESFGWAGVIRFIWFFVILVWRIQIAEYLIDIMNDDGFEYAYFFSYFLQFVYFWLLLLLILSCGCLFVLYKLAKVHLNMSNQPCKCVIFIKWA